MKPVHVQPITVSRMVGFNNNLAQMIIMTRLCGANKNRIARSKVRDRVCSLTLNIGFSETCLCAAHNFVMHGGIWKKMHK